MNNSFLDELDSSDAKPADDESKIEGFEENCIDTGKIDGVEKLDESMEAEEGTVKEEKDASHICRCPNSINTLYSRKARPFLSGTFTIFDKFFVQTTPLYQCRTPFGARGATRQKFFRAQWSFALKQGEM